MNKKIGNTAQLCSAQRVTVSIGPGKGLDLIIVDNGVLNFTLVESRCLDIIKFSHKGMNASFISKNGLCVTEDEFGHTFPAGMLYTCGLDSLGAREGHKLHGRAHNIPADIIELYIDEKKIKVVGEISITALFGENLLITRTIETMALSDSVKITDVIKNRAYRDEKYCMLYHINIGYPLLDEGAVIEADIEQTFSRNEWAERNRSRVLIMDAPSDNAAEMCYFHKLNKPEISLCNFSLKKRFTIKYSDNTLPYLVEWKSPASGDYVIGLEPCTTWLDDKFTYSTIKSGEEIKNSIVLSVTDITLNEVK